MVLSEVLLSLVPDFPVSLAAPKTSKFKIPFLSEFVCPPFTVSITGGHSEGGSGSGHSLENVLGSDDGGDSGGLTPQEELAQTRADLGMKPRVVSPDDKLTLAILYVDGQRYVGTNGGGKNIEFEFLAPPAETHAEIDAMNQAYQFRQVSAIAGGDATMYVDRPPCWSYCLTKRGNGAIATAFEQLELDSLTIIYGEGIERYRGVEVPRPGGIVFIIKDT